MEVMAGLVNAGDVITWPGLFAPARKLVTYVDVNGNNGRVYFTYAGEEMDGVGVPFNQLLHVLRDEKKVAA